MSCCTRCASKWPKVSGRSERVRSARPAPVVTCSPRVVLVGAEFWSFDPREKFAQGADKSRSRVAPTTCCRSSRSDGRQSMRSRKQLSRPPDAVPVLFRRLHGMDYRVVHAAPRRARHVNGHKSAPAGKAASPKLRRSTRLRPTPCTGPPDIPSFNEKSCAARSGRPEKG